MRASAPSRLRVVLRRSLQCIAVFFAMLCVCGVWLWNDPPRLYRWVVLAGQWQAGVSERYVEINGFKWRVLDSDVSAAGSQNTAIVLHGLGTSAEAMLPIASMFPPNTRVLIPDLPGFGEHASHGAVVHDAALYLDTLHDFHLHERLNRVDIVGASMGGALAAAYAARYPDLVRSLVLLSPAGVTAPVLNPFMTRVIAGEIPLDIKDEASLREVLRLNFVHPPPMPPPFRAAFIQRALDRRADYLRIVEDLRSFLTTGLEADLQSIQTPTLVLYGAQDQLTDASMLEVFLRRMPNAKGAILPDAGHVLSYDAPRAVDEAMRSFYESMP